MKGHWIAYSIDELAWLRANCTLVIGEYHRAFCERFGRDDVSASNIHSLRKRKGWGTGRTGQFAKGLEPHNKGKAFPAAKSEGARRNQFKKGQLPHNIKFAGHERVSKDGYVEISVEQVNPHTGYGRRYVLKHRWMWEQKHGPVPTGMALKCLGDRLNTDPANWELVPRALLPRLAGGRRKQHIAYDEAPDELKPAILAAAKLDHRVKTARRGSHD